MNRSEGIAYLIQQLREDQTSSGSWEYPFEAGTFTDAYMIILLRTLEIEDERLIDELTDRLVSRQETNGAWKLFQDDGNGNQSSTVEAYYALLYSGNYEEEDERLKKAKQFILDNGGIEKATLLTKMMLLFTGQYRWPRFFPLPIELILLPLAFPVNLYSMSVYGRMHMVPFLIAADKKVSIKTAKSPDLSELYSDAREDAFSDWSESDESRKLRFSILASVQKHAGGSSDLHGLALAKAKRYMMSGLEPDGTLFSYFTSTTFMIFALLALGHKKDDPLILKAVKGLYSFKTKVKGHTHIQFTTASIWDTSLISYALQEAGVRPTDPMIEKATAYLVGKQHDQYGDWVMHNQTAQPGGWGFSNINTKQPDLDDSTSSLRAITAQATNSSIYNRWNQGVNWVVSMQNKDGGWPAFEKNTNSLLLALLPIQESKGILTDPSTPDLTGRTMELLGNFVHLPKDDETLTRGVRWLKKNQEKDGSWEGQWGVQYIYGTWAALTGLAASGLTGTDETVKKAVQWLKSIQNQDGGWGESCLSDRNKSYTPLNASTLTHTAWALDALIAISDSPDKKMVDGLRFLLKSLDRKSWQEDYPAGKGLADRIYFHYHSYRYFYPLLALAHYSKKYD